VVIHVLAEQATVNGDSEMPGYLPGFGPVSSTSLCDIAATAKIRPLVLPSTGPEPGYRPSTALAEFVRCRDLTCRFPGCDRPAEVCDLDHTVPFPLGPTHASNLKLLCRFHHLLKTFWTAWHDVQLPDGTVQWTSPTGHTYTTKPAGALFFPILATPTGEIAIAKPDREPCQGRWLMMPRRKKTRAQERRYRISGERRINEARIFEEQRKHEAWLAATYEPPPF